MTTIKQLSEQETATQFERLGLGHLLIRHERMTAAEALARYVPRPPQFPGNEVRDAQATLDRYKEAAE